MWEFALRLAMDPVREFLGRFNPAPRIQRDENDNLIAPRTRMGAEVLATQFSGYDCIQTSQTRMFGTGPFHREGGIGTALGEGNPCGPMGRFAVREITR